jgi:hypothetical protein
MISNINRSFESIFNKKVVELDPNYMDESTELFHGWLVTAPKGMKLFGL